MISVFTTLFILGALSFWVLGQEEQPQPIKANIPMGKYAPKQPIDYSHRLHAGELQIDCQFAIRMRAGRDLRGSLLYPNVCRVIRLWQPANPIFKKLLKLTTVKNPSSGSKFTISRILFISPTNAMFRLGLSARLATVLLRKWKSFTVKRP